MVKIYPKVLKKIDLRTLGIDWEDGHESFYDTTTLREECTCAVCQDEWTGEKKIMHRVNKANVRGRLRRLCRWRGRRKPLQNRMLPKTVTPIMIDSVGQYGLTIKWSDGHSTGIYTYENLRQLCQCGDCQKKNR